MLFIYLISTLTNQVLNSPIIDQLSYEVNEQMLVDVPGKDGKNKKLRCTSFNIYINSRCQILL